MPFAGRLSPELKMVVFDEHGIEQTEPMVESAAATDRIFLQTPPAGHRLASVVSNAGLGSGDGIDESPSDRGNARKAADEIQQRPFGGEQAAGRTGQFR